MPVDIEVPAARLLPFVCVHRPKLVQKSGERNGETKVAQVEPPDLTI